MLISVFDKVENIVRRGENAGHQHFLLFPQCFEKPLLESLKVCLVKSYSHIQYAIYKPF